MGRLFGTDGVRGVANKDLLPELAFRLGRAAAKVLVADSRAGRGAEAGRILVGRDTRVSGEMLEAALVAGVTSAGVNVELLEVIPTPGVAYLTKKYQADAGVMISASHNPVADNGIKFFDRNGYKLTDQVEEEIESFLEEEKASQISRPIGLEVGRVTRRAEAVADYSAYLAQTIGERLDGLTVAVDCGFGATYQVAPQVLKSLGARVIPINNQNDGSRINVGCGSTNPQELQRVVTAEGAQVGLAHDGDGDRVIAVDERGELVDGDEIMAICGLRMLAEGRLPGKAIAATVYSNLGLREAFQKYGGEVIVTENGDRKVLEAMRERGLVLGGEQSGHIIFLEHNTTGDGILSALQLLSTMVHSGQPLSVLKKEMRKFPQLLENVRVARKTGWEENREIRRVIEAARENLGDNGRIFVRASGTEPLIRIMAEGPDREMLVRLINDIAGVIRKELS